MRKPTKFGVVQIFGFLIATTTFTLLLLVMFFDIPYSPQSQWVNIFAVLIPFYAATADWSDNVNEHERWLSIVNIFVGIILGVILLSMNIFQTTDWESTVFFVGLELIGASVAGLGLGAVT